MSRTSAGLLLYRRTADGLQVLLGHPGGPLWAKRDEGAWTLPKGELDGDEDPLAAARREFAEEIGTTLEDDRTYLPLGTVKQSGGKVVHAWAVECDLDADAVHSNLFTMEWPPRSGRVRQYPEVDRAQWFSLAEAGRKILPGQAPFLERLERTLESGGGRDESRRSAPGE